VIDLQIVFINFSILNIIYGPIRIVHLNNVPIYIQIRCYQNVHHSKQHIKLCGKTLQSNKREKFLPRHK
jgi:hypothetical protein